MSAPDLTQETLKSLIVYNPETGIFVWREREGRKAWNTRYANRRAGSVWTLPTGKRYWTIRILNWPFLGHRVAWLYMTGEWPSSEVDHRDLEGLNNRWSNLRLATHGQNGANRRANKNNKSGFKGVSLVKEGCYRATIQINGRWREIGRFPSAEAASVAYAAAAAAGHGEFARHK